MAMQALANALAEKKKKTDTTSWADVMQSLNDSGLGQSMYNLRYGGDQAKRPDELAKNPTLANAVGMPATDATGDMGQAQRYFAAKQFTEQHGPVGGLLAALFNRVHESEIAPVANVLVPGAVDKGSTNLIRLDAGDKGVGDALSAIPMTDEAKKRAVMARGQWLK